MACQCVSVLSPLSHVWHCHLRALEIALSGAALPKHEALNSLQACREPIRLLSIRFQQPLLDCSYHYQDQGLPAIKSAWNAEQIV
jgi:hypothetical protein